jgi:hypothetical protein
MSQALNDTDLDTLAAEYVLGTLGSDERVHAQALLLLDDGFATKVRWWERRFGELHLMVEPVDPDPQIWARIKDKFPGTPQNLPVSPAEPAKADGQGPAAETVVQAAASSADAAAAAEPATSAPAAEVAAPALAPADAPAQPTAAQSFGSDSSPTTEPAAEPAVSEPAAPQTNATAAASPASVGEAVAPSKPAPKPAPVIAASAPFPTAQTQLTTAAAPFPSAPRAPLVPGDEREQAYRRRLGRSRAVAAIMTLIVVAIGSLVAAWRFAPEYVPPVLQPVEALRAVGIEIDTGAPAPPPRPPAPPESRFDE